ncbi:MAG: PaaI family thioesterase [Desulfovibrionaceae bacterium]
MNIPPDATPIENIFADLPGCNCFVCSPGHDWGFRLEFFLDKAKKTVLSPMTGAKEDMAGFPGILHGGFQAMLLDEIMFYAAFALASRIVFTGRLEVKLSRTTPTNTPLLLEGFVNKDRGPLVMCEGNILEGERKLATATGTFYSPSMEEFRQATGLEEVPEKFAPYLR